MQRPSTETGSSSRYHLNDASASQDTAPTRTEIPSLAPIDPVGGLDLPSRFNSQRTSDHISSKPDAGTGPGAPGQDWLRSVDELSWPAAQPNRTTISPPSASYRKPGTPGVPRRSSRRTPSGDQSNLYPGQAQVGQFDFEGFEGSSGTFMDENNEPQPKWDRGGRF